MPDLLSIVVAVLGCIVFFEAIMVLAIAGQLRRAHRRDARWKAMLNDAWAALDAHRGAAEAWKRTAEEWERVATLAIRGERADA